MLHGFGMIAAAGMGDSERDHVHEQPLPETQRDGSRRDSTALPVHVSSLFSLSSLSLLSLLFSYSFASIFTWLIEALL
jgi:hypothetical protein